MRSKLVENVMSFETGVKQQTVQQKKKTYSDGIKCSKFGALSSYQCKLLVYFSLISIVYHLIHCMSTLGRVLFILVVVVHALPSLLFPFGIIEPE